MALSAICGWAIFSGAVQPSRAQSAGRVTLPIGAAFSDTISALATAADAVVVADVSVQERRLRQELKDASLDDALRTVSQDFDAHWVLRGRSLALQLRRTDPAETGGLELAEVQQVATDIGQLTSLAPQMSVAEFETLIASFVNSITPEQRKQMQEGALPSAALMPAQQQAIQRLSLFVAYDDTVGDLRNSVAALGQLERASLTVHATRQMDAVREERSLVLRAPRPVGNGTIAVMFHAAPPEAAAAAVSKAPGPGGQRFEAPDSDRGPPWAVAPTRMSIEGFARDWEARVGSSLRVPGYARNREFWIASAGGSRSDALQALADLWGWQAGSVGEGRVLGRPPFPRAANAVELHAGMRQAIPPAMWHAIHAAADRNDHRRTAAALTRVYERVHARVGIGGTLAVSQLEAEELRQFAHAALETALTGWWLAGGRAVRPKPYLVNPERVAVQLRSPLRGQKDETLCVGLLDGERFQLGWAVPAIKERPERE